MTTFSVTQQITFCYGHRLLDYKGKCAHPHGHNATAELTFRSSQLDHRGMVLDFSDIKKNLKEWIDQTLDHRMLLQEKDPLTPVLQKMKEPVVVMKGNPTAENIAQLIFEKAHSLGLPIVKVRVWESLTQSAEYESLG